MAVTFDAVGPSSAGTGASSVSSLSWSHTVGSGSGQMIVAGAECDYSSDTGVTTTWTSDASSTGVSQQALVHSNNQGQGFLSTATITGSGAAAGAHTIKITCSSAASDIAGGSTSVLGAGSTGTPVTATGSSTAPSVSVTAASTSLIIGFVACGDAVNSENNTRNWLNNFVASAGFATGNAASQRATGTGGSTTISWGINSAPFAVLALEVQAAATGGNIAVWNEPWPPALSSFWKPNQPWALPVFQPNPQQPPVPPYKPRTRWWHPIPAMIRPRGMAFAVAAITPAALVYNPVCSRVTKFQQPRRFMPQQFIPLRVGVPFQFAVGVVTGTGSSRQVTVNRATALGDTLLVVVVVNNTTCTVSSVTDSAGNVYTLDQSFTTTLPTVYAFRSPGATGGSAGGQTAALPVGGTVTVTTAAVSGNVDINCTDAPGVGPVDQIPAIATGTSTTPSVSATPTSDFETAVSYFGTANSGGNPTVNSPFTTIATISTSGNPFDTSAYEILGSGTSGNSQTSTLTIVSAAWRAGMWTFRSLPPEIVFQSIRRNGLRLPTRLQRMMPITVQAVAPVVLPYNQVGSRARWSDIRHVPRAITAPPTLRAIPATGSRARPAEIRRRPRAVMPLRLQVSGPPPSIPQTGIRAHWAELRRRPRASMPLYLQVSGPPPVTPKAGIRARWAEIRRRSRATMPPPLQVSGPILPLARPRRVFVVSAPRPVRRQLSLPIPLPALQKRLVVMFPRIGKRQAQLAPPIVTITQPTVPNPNRSAMARWVEGRRRRAQQFAPPVIIVPVINRPLPRKTTWWGTRTKRTQQFAPSATAPPVPVIQTGLPAKARWLGFRWKRTQQARIIGAAPPPILPFQMPARRTQQLSQPRRPQRAVPAVPSVPVPTPRIVLRGLGLRRKTRAGTVGAVPAPPIQAPARRKPAPTSARRASQLPPTRPSPPVPPNRTGGRPRLATFLRTVRKLARQIVGLAPVGNFPGHVFISNRNAEPLTLFQTAPEVDISDRAANMVAITNADGICTVTNQAVGFLGVMNS